jgi:hypothetical protein
MTSPQTPLRIIIADDQASVREGLALLLRLLPDFEVVGGLPQRVPMRVQISPSRSCSMTMLHQLPWSAPGTEQRTQVWPTPSSADNHAKHTRNCISRHRIRAIQRIQGFVYGSLPHWRKLRELRCCTRHGIRAGQSC